MQNILFIDRDGTLIEEPDDFQIDALAKIRLYPGVISALQRLSQAGFRLIMVTNQDGLGTTSFPYAAFQASHDFILHLFASQGIFFQEIFICPHFAEDNCRCRKPKIGLLETFLQQNPMNTENSWVIGDRSSDQNLAENLNIGFFDIKREGWDSIVKILLHQKRSASIHRTTKETDIKLSLELNANKESVIKTPLGFFSHMLEQVAKHAGFSLDLRATGDIAVDDHHLIEDTAIALGEALKKALSDKWGINRYGFTLPMDESLATVVLDLCGRSHMTFNGCFTREYVGGMATEMVPHFFYSLASSLNATIHISVSGKNNHHMVEACFKAFGRALGQAMMQTCFDLPSTKGIL